MVIHVIGTVNGQVNEGMRNVATHLAKEFEKENIWLHSYALYMALKEEFNMLPWNEWHDNIRLKNKETVAYYENLLSAVYSVQPVEQAEKIRQ